MNDYRDRLISALGASAVMIVAGTGVSRALSRDQEEADWVGLIRSGLRQIETINSGQGNWVAAQRASLDVAVEERDVPLLIGVAGQVVARLTQTGEQPYVDWLRETVGALKVREPSLGKAIAGLRSPILTTNYDLLLEDALHRTSANWTDTEAMREIFRGDSESVGHLHGDWKHPSSVVLSPEHYANLRANDPTQALETAHYSSKSFLYLGYGAGLADPNFSSLLDWHRRLFPQSRGDHFRLCLESEFDELTALHANDDIRVVAYGAEFSELPMFLDSLATSASGSRSTSRLGRDAVAYAREAIVDQIRAETVIGDGVENFDDRDLHDITVRPVLLPMPHEQFVSARAVENDARPERIDTDKVYVDDKVLIVAGEELSGVTTALRWIVANAAIQRARTAPIFVDARNCTVTARPLERQVRTEAYKHGLIFGKKDPLPSFALAVDNVKPQATRDYENLIADIAANNAPFIVLGCREGDESQLVEDLKNVGLSVEIAYLGKLGRFEVEQFARILAPHRQATISDSVLKVVRSERLPRTPFTVALLVVLLAQGPATGAINNSETAVLEQYVSMLLGRTGPFLDPRHYLDPQNREGLLSQFAKELVRARRGAMAEGEAIQFIADYFVSRDWDESATEVLGSFGRMRLLRVGGGVVQFQQTSYLHLFAAKAATKDPAFLAELLSDPLYFSPIIRHYAALVRDSEDVVLRMKQVLDEWAPLESNGRFYGSVRLREVADEPDHDDEHNHQGNTTSEILPDRGSEATDTTEPDQDESSPSDEDYDESSDADRIPFPLDDPSTWPAPTRLAAGLELASRVLRDSDDLANLEIKSDVFRLVLSRWGYLAELYEQEHVFDDVASQITELLIREDALEEELRDRFQEDFALYLSGFSIYRFVISTLASRKLIRTYERVRDEPGVRDDPYSAFTLALFAMNVRSSGWTDELLALADKHGTRWSTISLVRGIARLAWRRDTLTLLDASNLRDFIKRGYASRHTFANDRIRKIKLKRLDQELAQERADGLAGRSRKETRALRSKK